MGKGRWTEPKSCGLASSLAVCLDSSLIHQAKAKGRGLLLDVLYYIKPTAIIIGGQNKEKKEVGTKMETPGQGSSSTAGILQGAVKTTRHEQGGVLARTGTGPIAERGGSVGRERMVLRRLPAWEHDASCCGLRQEPGLRSEDGDGDEEGGGSNGGR